MPTAAAEPPIAAHGHAPRPSPRLLRKNISVTALGFAIGGLVGFAVQTVIAREQGPHAFGTYVAALSLVTIFGGIYELGGARYLVRESAREPGRLGTLLADIVTAKVVLATSAIAITTGVGAAIGFHGRALAIVALLAVMTGANAVMRGLRSGLAAIERLEISSAIAMINNVVSAAGMIWIIAAGGSIVAAVAYSAAISVVLVPVTWLVLRRWVRMGGRASLRRSARTARTALPFATVGALSFVSAYGSTLIVRALIGDAPAGLFGAASRLTEVLAFIPAIVVEGLYRPLSYLASHARQEFARTMERTAAFLFLAGLALAAGGSLVGDRVLALVFGSGFADGAGAFHILLWSLPVAFPSWLLVAGVVIGARPQSAAKILAASFTWTLVADLFVVPAAGIRGAAVVSLSAECFIAVACTRALARNGTPVRWTRVAWSGIVAAPALVAAVAATQHLPLLVPVAAGALAYVLALLALGVHVQLGVRSLLGVRLPGGQAHEMPPMATPAASRDAPLISVVMPMRNAAPYVAEAIEGILRQTVSDLELLVLDDGSTDGSAGIVSAIEDPRVRLVRRAHRGLVATANEGFALARGRYVARADADDLFDPTLLERELAVLTAHPGTAAAGVFVREFGARRTTFGYPVTPTRIRRALRHGNPLSQPALIRADALRAVGGLRDVRWEDWDLWVRLARDHDLRNVPEVLLHVRAHGASLYRSSARTERRRAKLRCLTTASRMLGPTPGSLAAIARTGIAVLTYAFLDRRVRATAATPPVDPVIPSMSVVVPTLARPALLARCLAGIAAQERTPLETVVVARPDDTTTRVFLEAWARGHPATRRVALVDRPGLVHALIAGTSACRGDVIAYLDDDAVPRAGWLAELGRMFLDPTVGAAGGALVDRIDGEVVTGTVRVPGRITWYGRIIGRHHHTTRHYGDTDWLTGSNMAFRLAFANHDARLRHSANGLALANDTDVCLSVRAAGARVAFTPFAVVEHDATSFRDPALGSRVNGDDVACASANRTYALLKFLPPARRLVFRIYAALVGAATVPGPLRVLLEIRHSARAREMASRLAAARRGRTDGIAMWREWRRDARVPTPARIAVLSPHLDDAVLSLGAMISDAVRAGSSVEVITVFAGAPGSTTDPGPWDARAGFVTAGAAARARRTEDAAACAAIGATCRWLDIEDEQYERTADAQRIWNAIEPLIADAEAVYVPGFPLAHVDHAWLHDLVCARAGDRPLILYAEQPYTMRSRAPLPADGTWRVIAPSRAGRRAKRRAAAAYVSQWPLLGGPLLRSRLRRAEHANGGEAIAPLPRAVRPAAAAPMFGSARQREREPVGHVIGSERTGEPWPDAPQDRL